MPHGIVEEEYSSAEHIVLSVLWVDKRRKGARKRLECYGINYQRKRVCASRLGKDGGKSWNTGS